MLCIDNLHTDVYFNLAAEEYLLKNFPEPVFMLWQNEPCVIIGRHQRVTLEVNTDFIQEKAIKLARRYSGGGTVYQDMGNINLTFIASGKQPDFDRYPEQMQNILTAIGIRANADKRRGLYINGLKISGSAQYIRGNKSLYHATLLFSSNLTDLTLSLENQNATKKELDEQHPGYRVSSIKSPVTNIEDHLTMPLTIGEFKKMIIKTMIQSDSTNSDYQFSQDDIAAITILKQKKYATEGWNLTP